MLQHFRINHFSPNNSIKTGWSRWPATQEFIRRRFSAVNFRNRLLAGTILLVVVCGLVNVIFHSLLLQPTQLQVKFYKLNLIGMALFGGLGAVFSFIISRQWHRPMRSFIDGVQRIGNGDFDHRIDLAGDDEMVRLGKSFNRMASYLKLREEQLQRSEALYRHLIQDALDGIFVVDRELRFIEVNEKFCQMLGYRREEVLRSTLAQVLAVAGGAEENVDDLLARRPFRGELVIQPREDFNEASSPLARELLFSGGDDDIHPPALGTAFARSKSNGSVSSRNGKVADREVEMGKFSATPYRFNHVPRIIDLNAAPINHELYMGIARDITEKKHYEAELHRAAEVRELLLRTMNDGVAVLDREGYLLISNRALEEIFEMSHAELMQRRFIVFKNDWQFRTLDDQSLPAEANPIHLALNEQQRISDYRLKICRPDHEKYLSVNASPLYDERLQLIGAIVALRDITAAVQSERAREILQQKMQQTAKLASLGELAAGVAHEINNPMTGIINYAQILYDRAPKDRDDHPLLQGIVEESERVTKIVRNLLTFARQQPQEHGYASLPEILDSSLHLMAHRLRKDGITLICEIPEDLPPIKCRSQQIQQVFINLLSNAHHALNQRYPGYHDNKLLKIQAHCLQRNGRHFIRTEVHDSGAGIAPEIMPKIFDPFFTTKNRSEGTGLGLSISYGIIKDHQGEIFVESQLGDYTTFVIELPIENGTVTGETGANCAL
jgi:PAS domain S-box-containing protein